MLVCEAMFLGVWLRPGVGPHRPCLAGRCRRGPAAGSHSCYEPERRASVDAVGRAVVGGDPPNAPRVPRGERPIAASVVGGRLPREASPGVPRGRRQTRLLVSTKWHRMGGDLGSRFASAAARSALHEVSGWTGRVPGDGSRSSRGGGRLSPHGRRSTDSRSPRSQQERRCEQRSGTVPPVGPDRDCNAVGAGALWPHGRPGGDPPILEREPQRPSGEGSRQIPDMHPMKP